MTANAPVIVDLSHTITDGMETYPGLPTPRIEDHLSREAAEEIYGPGVRFQIGLITLCTNTGTYLDVPFHRYDDGHDLAQLPLERVSGVPGLMLDRRGEVAIDISPDEIVGAAGHALIVRTDHSDHFGTDRYAVDHPHLTASSAEVLAAAGVACVGIDSLNIDSTDDTSRPVHSILLGQQIPIIEHLTNLSGLPAGRFRFSAVPPKIEGAGTFPVRAHAVVAEA